MDPDMTLLLFFLGCSLIACSKFPLRQYHYVDMVMTWTDAQHYCRENYTDLATFENMEDIHRLNRPQLSSTWTWIGLRDAQKSWKRTMGNDVNSWRWSATGETSKSGYHNWETYQPDYYQGKETCVMMASNGQWFDQPCHLLKPYVCYSEINETQKTYMYIDTERSWFKARTYCRTHHTDLAMIENSTENTEVYFTKPTSASAWIGLYREPWTWSDQTRISFTNWKSTAPDNYYSQHCAAESNLHIWNDLRCRDKFTFLCHEVSILKTTVRMMIQTDADITDPSTNNQILQQLGSVLQSQGFTGFTLQWKLQPKKQPPETLNTPYA
ncbi:macrophage mannose receptor 1-like [Sphaeramia orbicularis]|uniref:macrophage mannose receptor 1-like n=1 Tax=Sphaeramia orbicularis TaxID=375764 RepID=UPI00117EB313|nr:macrophage mannose receptor 1-like [Sphaeramia orbicularis]